MEASCQRDLVCGRLIEPVEPMIGVDAVRGVAISTLYEFLRLLMSCSGALQGIWGGGMLIGPCFALLAVPLMALLGFVLNNLRGGTASGLKSTGKPVDDELHPFTATSLSGASICVKMLSECVDIGV